MTADSRQRVRAELLAIEPLDLLEKDHLDAAIAWVDSDAGLFRLAKPATPDKHLVSYFALVDDDHILLVDHKNARLWLPTGGHVEPNEDPRVTVVRELQEELGLRVDVAEIGPPQMLTVTDTVGISAGHTDVSLWYVVRASRSDRLHYDDSEFNAVAWFAFGQVPSERCEPHLGRFIAKLNANESV